MGQASSDLAIYAWRRLRSLGAHYLQESVCVLPDRPETAREMAELGEHVEQEGGRARLFPMQLADAAEVTAAFSAEREDEYGEVVGRAGAFLAEITKERSRGRTTYTEFEESEADLKRLERWLASIRKRDYFDAPRYADAVEAVEACARALAEFEAEAFASEVRSSADSAARELWRRRLPIGEAADS